MSKSGRVFDLLGLAAVPAALLVSAQAAWASEDGGPTTEPIWSLALTYKADLFSVVEGGAQRGTRYLDNLDIVADVDLDRAIGWSGATAHASLLNNLGGRPNDLAGTLQA